MHNAKFHPVQCSEEGFVRANCELKSGEGKDGVIMISGPGEELEQVRLGGIGEGKRFEGRIGR